MAVELIKVQFHIDDNVLNGVIDAKRYPNLRLGVYACTSYLRNRKRVACVYGVIMHAGNVRRMREKRVKHEA